jgi:hypothetical protein
VVDAAAPASVPQQAKADIIGVHSGPSAGPSVLASVPRGGAFESSQEQKVRHTPCTPHLAARLCSHARHLRTHSAPFSAPHRRWCVLQMLITSPRGNLPGLPGNWDASPGIPVKTCDKKERKETKTNVHLMQQTSYISKDHAGHVGAESNGSSSCCKQCHAIREKLMPYLDHWPTLLEFAGELNLRHSCNNKYIYIHVR